MARARAAEPSPATGGNTLLLMVGLSIVSLLMLALLSTRKAGGDMLSESSLLYVALILYAGASALYVGFAVTGREAYVRFASLATLAGFAANTAAAAHRWYVAGRPPFSNMYEMLLSFVWTVVLLTILSERRYKVKVLGTVTMPLAVVSVVLMQLMPSAVRPLMPALQSTWLHIHVTLAMLSYAAMAVSFALAMMFLVQDKLSNQAFLACSSGSLGLIYLGLMTRVTGSGGLQLTAYDAAEMRELFVAQGAPLFVTVPELGWLFLLALVAVVAPLAIYAAARITGNEPWMSIANRSMFVALLFQLVTLAFFVVRARGGDLYGSADAPGLFQTSLRASPFILAGLVGGLFITLLYLMLMWRREALENMMPSADTLDRLTYKAIGIGFPLLTAMIAAGAYWANQAWGQYWQWDPKETWAAITWVTYAGYLHMRITRGWRGRRAAYFAIIGFAVVVFTFFGVTYLLPGLHAYA